MPLLTGSNLNGLSCEWVCVESDEGRQLAHFGTRNQEPVIHFGPAVLSDKDLNVVLQFWQAYKLKFYQNAMSLTLERRHG